MITIHTGRLVPRPPLHVRPDEFVDILGADNARQRVRADSLRPGNVLAGFGVLVRIERAAEAA